VTVVAPGIATAVAREGYRATYFPEAPEFVAAGRIRLAGGAQAEVNLHLTLEPFYAVTATALLPNGRPFSGNQASQGFSATPAFVAVLDAGGRRLPYGCQFDQATRTFQANLPDGVYSLLVSVAAEEPNRSEPGNALRGKAANPASLTGFVEFSVEGHAVQNLRIPLAPMAGWPIHLRAERKAIDSPQANAAVNRGLQNVVSLTATEAAEPSLDAAGGDTTSEVAGPDLLEMSRIALGPNWIGVQVNDRALCLDSFVAGGRNFAREPLDLGPMTAAPPMEIVLRDDCARLELQLPQGLSAFLPGDEPFYTVYVVPDFDTPADVPPMAVHPSSGASLTVDGLTPGNYHVYTFDRPVRLEYRNPAALAALPRSGQAITLASGNTTELVLEAPGR